MSVTFSIMYVRQQKERVTVFYDNNQLYFNLIYEVRSRANNPLMES